MSFGNDFSLTRSGGGRGSGSSMLAEPSRKGATFDIYELRYAADFVSRFGPRWSALAQQLNRCVIDVRRNCEPDFHLHDAATGRVDGSVLTAFISKGRDGGPHPAPSPASEGRAKAPLRGTTSSDRSSPHPRFNVAGRDHPAKAGPKRDRTPGRKPSALPVLTAWESRAGERLGLKHTSSLRLLGHFMANAGTDLNLDGVRACGLATVGRLWTHDSAMSSISILRSALARAGVPKAVGYRRDLWGIGEADAARIREMVG